MTSGTACYHACGAPARRCCVLACSSLAIALAPRRQVEIKAQTQLVARPRSSCDDDGVVEVTGQLVDKLTGEGLAGQTRRRSRSAARPSHAITEPDGTFHVDARRPSAGPVSRSSSRYGGDRALDRAEPLAVTTDPSKRAGRARHHQARRRADRRAASRVDGDRATTARLDVPVALAVARAGRPTRCTPLLAHRPSQHAVRARARKTPAAPASYRAARDVRRRRHRQAATAEVDCRARPRRRPRRSLSTTRARVRGRPRRVTGTVIDDDGDAGRARRGHADVRRSPARARRDRRRRQLSVQASRPRSLGQRRSSALQVARRARHAVRQAEPLPSRRSSTVAAPQPVPVSYTVAAFLATALAAGGVLRRAHQAVAAAAPPAPPAEVRRARTPIEPADGGLVVAQARHRVDAAPRRSDDGFSGVVRDTVRGRPVAERGRRGSLLGDARARASAPAPTAAFALEQPRAPASGAPRSPRAGHVTERFARHDPAPRRAARRARRSGAGARARVPALSPRRRAGAARAAAVGHLVAAPDRRSRARASGRRPALAELTDFVEEIYFSPRLAAESRPARARTSASIARSASARDACAGQLRYNVARDGRHELIELAVAIVVIALVMLVLRRASREEPASARRRARASASATTPRASAKPRRERKRREIEAEAEASRARKPAERRAREPEPETPSRRRRRDRGRVQGRPREDPRRLRRASSASCSARSRSTPRPLDELEEVLFTADIGPRAADRIFQSVKTGLSKDRARGRRQDLDADPRDLARDPRRRRAAARPRREDSRSCCSCSASTASARRPRSASSRRSGRREGKKVLLAAGDTFRAAATEQLEEWAQARRASTIVKGKPSGDPSSVIFDAIKRGVDEGYDIVICDTAGRLHSNAGLMDELKKVRRVVRQGDARRAARDLDGARRDHRPERDLSRPRRSRPTWRSPGSSSPSSTARRRAASCSGICDELKVPVRFVGIGEKIGDLRPFDPAAFVDALYERRRATQRSAPDRNRRTRQSQAPVARCPNLR